MEEVKTGNTVKTSNTEKVKNDKKAIITYLQEEYKPEKGVKLVVKYLWYKYYRLNFWAQRSRKGSRGTEEYIKESKFIQVELTPDGYLSEELEEKGN